MTSVICIQFFCKWYYAFIRHDPTVWKTTVFSQHASNILVPKFGLKVTEKVVIIDENCHNSHYLKLKLQVQECSLEIKNRKTIQIFHLMMIFSCYIDA